MIKLYTEDEYIPLNNEQKHEFAQHLGRLKDILTRICQNFADNPIGNLSGLNLNFIYYYLVLLAFTWNTVIFTYIITRQSRHPSRSP